MSTSARPEGTGAPAGASGTPSPASKPAASSAPRQGSYVRTVLKVLTGSATAQAIPLLAMLLFTRMVSVEALGIYAIWQAVIYIAIVPATARMEVLLVALPLAVGHNATRFSRDPSEFNTTSTSLTVIANADSEGAC